MDEITLLESSLPDAPPPAPEVVARARARLAAHEVRRRPRRTWALIIGAATATAAVVTAAALAATLLAHAPAPVSAPVSASAVADAEERRATASGTRGQGGEAARRDRCLLEVADHLQKAGAGGHGLRPLLDRLQQDKSEWTPAEPGALSV